LGIDLKTPSGRLVFGMMVQIADDAVSAVMRGLALDAQRASA
jgi:hypothetical protein